MYVSPSVGLSVCLLAFQSVTLITSKDSRRWLWPHCYTIRTRALGLKSGVLVRGSRAAPAALNGLKFFRTQGGFSLFWSNVFRWCKCFGDLDLWVGTWGLRPGIWEWNLGQKAGIWALGLKFGPQGREWGLEAWILAWRLEICQQGFELGFKAEIRALHKTRKQLSRLQHYHIYHN